MPAVSAIIEELIDGAGYIRLPNLMSAAEAAEARTRALEIAASPDAATLGRRHERTGQQHIRGLLGHGEIFERLAQHQLGERPHPRQIDQRLDRRMHHVALRRFDDVDGQIADPLEVAVDLDR